MTLGVKIKLEVVKNMLIMEMTIKIIKKIVNLFFKKYWFIKISVLHLYKNKK